jgi:hypothetical protein
MQEIFPELRYASDIEFRRLSKKSLRRFSTLNPGPETKQRGLRAHAIFDDYVSVATREVANNLLLRVPALMEKLRWTKILKSEDRLLDGFMHDRNISNQAIARRVLLREMLLKYPVVEAVSRKASLVVIKARDEGGRGDLTSARTKVTSQRIKVINNADPANPFDSEHNSSSKSTNPFDPIGMVANESNGMTNHGKKFVGDRFWVRK